MRFIRRSDLRIYRPGVLCVTNGMLLSCICVCVCVFSPVPRSWNGLKCLWFQLVCRDSPIIVVVVVVVVDKPLTVLAEVRLSMCDWGIDRTPERAYWPTSETKLMSTDRLRPLTGDGKSRVHGEEKWTPRQKHAAPWRWSLAPIAKICIEEGQCRARLFMKEVKA